MLDLTVASIPIYFGTMAAEHRYLKRRAAEGGPTAGDYTPEDTATSLAMGVGSLIAPLVMPRLVRSVVPGKGKHGKVLLGAVAAAVVAASLADRIAAQAPDERSAGDAPDQPEVSRRRRRARLAAKARRVTAPVAVVDDPDEAVTAA